MFYHLQFSDNPNLLYNQSQVSQNQAKNPYLTKKNDLPISIVPHSQQTTESSKSLNERSFSQLSANIQQNKMPEAKKQSRFWTKQEKNTLRDYLKNFPTTSNKKILKKIRRSNQLSNRNDKLILYHLSFIRNNEEGFKPLRERNVICEYQNYLSQF